MKKMKKIFYLLSALLLTVGVSAQAQHNHSHEGAVHSKGFATMDKGGVLAAYEFERKAVGDNDILIEILYSGICHSDIHQSRDEWGGSIFPMVPGHEIATSI